MHFALAGSLSLSTEPVLGPSPQTQRGHLPWVSQGPASPARIVLPCSLPSLHCPVCSRDWPRAVVQQAFGNEFIAYATDFGSQLSLQLTQMEVL